MRPNLGTKVVIKVCNILNKLYIHNEKDNIPGLRLKFYPQKGTELRVNI